MKKFLLILASLLAAAAAVSCTFEIVPSPSDDEEIIRDNGNAVPEGFKVVSINAVQGNDTKTSYEGDVTFSWTSGDAISVYCTDATEPANTAFYTFSTTGSGSSASFSGVIPATAEVGDMALFPANPGHAYVRDTVWFKVAADTSLVTAGSADIPMYGANDGAGTFAFTHLAGAFKLNVNNVPAGVTDVKVSFTAASSKMSGSFNLIGDGPRTWAATGGTDVAARTITRECPVTSNEFTVYFPYTTGTVWGSSSITVKDYTGGSEGSVLYTNDAVGAFPVTRKQVTRLGTLSCGYRSVFGVDWSGVSATANTSPTKTALKSIKAKSDDTYLYVLLEVDGSQLNTTLYDGSKDTFSNLFNFYIGTPTGDSGQWGAQKVTHLTEVWAVYNNNITFKHWSAAYISSNLAQYQDSYLYEVRFLRSWKTSMGSTPIKVGVRLNSTYVRDGESRVSGSDIGVIPSSGEEMYEAAYDIEPEPSSTVATASPVSKTYRESLTETVNPERGMYRHNEYHFKEGLPASTSVTCEDDKTLALLIIYLEDYMAEADLSEAIPSIRTILGNVRSAGKKAIVRFAYNDKHHEADKVTPINPREPTTLSIITDHLDALEDVFEDYKDIIYLVQAGFLGTYGEWYYTTTSGVPLFPMSINVTDNAVTNFANRSTVLAKILSVVPNTIQVALRTPAYKRYFLSPSKVDGTGSWSTIDSWDGTDDNSRLSLHNDAFLADANDMGTFDNDSEDRSMWMSQSARLAIGGETGFVSTPNPTYCGLEPSLTAIADYHYSYLNDARSNNNIVKYWIANDFYPLIRKALGYRLVLNNLSIAPAGTYASGQSVSFSFKISNTGSASVIYPRPCKLVLLHGSTPTVLKDLTAEHDIRDITPGGNHTYSFDVTLTQNICEGDKLAIWMPDKTAGLQSTASYSIRLSNNDVSWENGYNIIHTF